MHCQKSCARALRSNNETLPAITGDESWELPVTATNVIARSGRVALADLDIDYRNRAVALSSSSGGNRDNPHFDWPSLIAAKDREITRLEGRTAPVKRARRRDREVARCLRTRAYMVVDMSAWDWIDRTSRVMKREWKR